MFGTRAYELAHFALDEPFYPIEGRRDGPFTVVGGGRANQMEQLFNATYGAK